MKTTTKVGFVVFTLIVLFSASTNAEIFSTIGMKGLSFINPQAGQVVQMVMGLSNPASFVEGYVVGQISGELVGEIAKQSPEAAEAIKQYNQVQGWVADGAQITQDLKLNEKGELAGGAITLGEKEQDVSFLVNPKAERWSMKASNMELSSKEEGGDVTFKAKTGGHAEIKGKKYENLAEGSTLVTDREGQVKEADLTFTKPTTLELGGKQIQAEQGMRVVYKEGILEVYGKGQTVTVDTQKIGINSENIKIDNKKITGEDFTLEGNRFTGTKQGELAEITQVNEGYLMGKNTIAESNTLTIRSDEGNTLFSKSCQTGGYDNYINPCGKTLSMEGKGFSVQLKEGNNFGLEVGKGDVLKYEMDGGKAVLNNGQETISAKKGDVKVTNGGMVKTYKEVDGVTQTLLDADSVGKNPDVDLNTKFGELACYDDSKTGEFTEYTCGETTTGAAVTGAASFYERCKAAVFGNKGEANQAVAQPEWQIGNVKGAITDEGKLEQTVLPNGEKGYKKDVWLRDSKGDLHQYRMYSDGSIYTWEDVKWKDTNLALNKEGLEEWGFVEKPKTTTTTPQQKSIAEAYQDSWDQLWNKLRTAEKDKSMYYTVKSYHGEGITYLQPNEGRNDVNMMRNSEFIVQPVKDQSGKTIALEGIDSDIKFLWLSGGKVKRVK